MRLLRRLVGLVVLLLSAAVAACCVAGIVAIWMFHQAIVEKIETVSVRLNGALERVSAANQNVRRAVEKARDDVASVDRESADLGGGGEKGRRSSRAVRALIQQKAGPDIDDLGGRLATMADAAVAVSSLLESAQEVVPEQSARINHEQLKQRADEVRQLAATLRKLEAVVGDADGEAGKREVADATSRVDGALQRCQTAVDNWQAQLDGVRDDLARAKAKTLAWLTFAAVAVSAVLGWLALGQISLFGRGLRWCFGA